MDYNDILDTGNVHEMRGEYRAMCDKIDALQDEASFLIGRMQEICEHPSVAEYSSSISNSAIQGICLVCGLEGQVGRFGQTLNADNVVETVRDANVLNMLRKLDFDLVNKLTRRK